MTGIGRKMKEKSPNTIVVGADPEGSILAQPESVNKTDVTFYEVEGVGYDFIPTGFDRSIVDRWIKTNDKQSLLMARRLIREEGLLCGGSSGAVVSAAMAAAKDLKKGQKVVVLLPDSIRNYLTKFVSDHWMEARGFQECVNVNKHWWWDHNINNIKLESLITATANITCERVMNIMKKQGIDQVPIVDNKTGGVISMVTMQKLLNVLISGNVKSNDSITKAAIPVFPKIAHDANLGLVSRILEREHYVLVIEKQSMGGVKIEKPVGIITAIDLLHYISDKSK